MVDTVSIATLATQMSTQQTSQQIDIAVLQKAKEVQDQQGKQALQLLQSSVITPDSVDVHV